MVTTLMIFSSIESRFVHLLNNNGQIVEVKYDVELFNKGDYRDPIGSSVTMNESGYVYLNDNSQPVLNMVYSDNTFSEMVENGVITSLEQPDGVWFNKMVRDYDRSPFFEGIN